MVAVTCFAATNMNDPIGPAIVGAFFSDFSGESPSSFTFTAAPDKFVVSSSLFDFCYFLSLPFSGTIAASRSSSQTSSNSTSPDSISR